MVTLISIGILAVLCAVVEVQLMERIPLLAAIITKLGPLGSLAFSLALSIFLGSIFGAAGLIAFIAGVSSTFLAQPYYVAKRNGKWTAYQEKYAGYKKTYSANKDLYAKRANQLVDLFKVIFAIVAAPFVLYFKARDGATAVRVKVAKATNYAKKVRY